MLCHMYKIHSSMVPDLGFLSDNGRNGVKYFAKENPQAPKKTQNIRKSSFFSQGPLLFNLLPITLRKPVTRNTPEEAKAMKDRFKKWLDKWLELIPDQPTTPGLTYRTADSNKLVDQVRAHKNEIAYKWKAVEKKLLEEEKKAEEARNKANEEAGNNGEQRKGDANNNHGWRSAPLPSRWDN